jgi:multisubunit Na+/H+ antiporter MnhF subunit
MNELLGVVLYISLAIHIILMGVGVWRIWRGENVIDRLMGSELLSTLTLAVLVLAAMIQGRSTIIDVALGLAALAFVGTIALARYIADEQVF